MTLVSPQLLLLKFCSIIGLRTKLDANLKFILLDSGEGFSSLLKYGKNILTISRISPVKRADLRGRKPRQGLYVKRSVVSSSLI